MAIALRLQRADRARALGACSMELAQRWVPYCGEAPGPEAWLGRWNLDPVLGLGLLLAAGLLWWPRHGGLPSPLTATAAGPADDLRRAALRWAWGLAVLLYVSPLCALSSAFFTVRVLHHMALLFVLAPLLVFGLAPRLRRLPAPLWLATALASAVFWLWHAPAPYAAALSSVPVYALMQASLLASAAWFWLASSRARPAPALLAILASTVLMGLLGALITFAAQPLYAPHLASTLAWGVAPLDDQQFAGITMWAPGSAGYLAAALLIARRWLQAERTPVPRPA